MNENEGDNMFERGVFR